MKVYLVLERSEETWVEAAFATRRLAERYLERGIRLAYDEVILIRERRRAMADSWVKAGGGLSVPLAPIPTLEDFTARWSWVIEECDFYESLP